MTDKSLTHAYLKKCFDYCPETGIVRWKISNARRKKGEEAGYLSYGYRRIGIKGGDYPAHRLIWFLQTGEWPKLEIDHINHIRDDNRWENLRQVSSLLNGRNLPLKKSNISGHTGVFWHKVNKNWCAQVSVNGKAKHLGSFQEKADAIKARQEANKEYGFHENHGVMQNGIL
jgi:hypothetical protein